MYQFEKIFFFLFDIPNLLKNFSRSNSLQGIYETQKSSKYLFVRCTIDCMYFVIIIK